MEFMFVIAASGFRQFSKGRLRLTGCGFATPCRADTMIGWERGQLSACGIDHGLWHCQIRSISENWSDNPEPDGPDDRRICSS